MRFTILCILLELLAGVSAAVAGSAAVRSVTPRPGTETVYNLEVHRAHTYFVSDAKLWVHNNYLTAADTRAIAGGHAWTKHAGDWAHLGVPNPNQLSELLAGIAAGPPKGLSRGRLAWFDGPTGIVLIFDPNRVDKGTAFIPKAGRSYFDGLR